MKHTIFSFFLFLFFAYPGTISAQEQTFVIDSEAPYEVYVNGTSTLHDWSAAVATVIDFPATMTLGVADGGQIESFGFKAEVNSMDGGRGSTMNNKIYKALQAETNPHIVYQQEGPATIEAMPDGAFKLTSTGKLSMAGVEKEVTVDVMATMEGDKLIFKGEKALKMSDFEIEAPSALFGQIQTYDDISVHFVFNYLAQ